MGINNLRKITNSLLGLLLISTLYGQDIDSTYTPFLSLSEAAVFVTTDALQQVYIATEKGRIQKFNKNGQLLFEYNNHRLGTIGLIDASNPFNVLVYYPELATIILLDRTLSEIKSINLFDLNIFEPQAVALSNDNHIWIYDPINFQLKKISRAGVVLFQSKPLNQATQAILQPTFLIERNNQLFLGDTLNGIFIFDGFGQLKKQIQIPDIHQIQILSDQLLYLKKGKLYSYSLISSSEKELFALPTPTHTIAFLPTKLLLIHGKTVSVRSLELDFSP